MSTPDARRDILSYRLLEVASDYGLYATYWDRDQTLSREAFDAEPLDRRIVRMANRWFALGIRDTPEDRQVVRDARRRVRAARATSS